MIFDILPTNEFIEGKSKHNYDIRKSWMQTYIKDYQSEYHNIRFVPVWYCGCNQSMIDYWLDYSESHNMEGVMLNKITPYYCKRHAGLIKIKAFKHSDLKIVGYEEGANKYRGMLGAIIIKGMRLMGSGFTDEQRKEYWGSGKSLVK